MILMLLTQVPHHWNYGDMLWISSIMAVPTVSQKGILSLELQKMEFFLMWEFVDLLCTLKCQ